MKKVAFLLFVMASSYNSCMVAQSKEPAETDFLKKVLSEKIYFADKQVNIDALAWNPHASFKGVYLKHLITGQDTGSKLSCHIVKVEPNCILDTHMHDGKIEIHEVISGSGVMYLDGKEFSYSVGQMCVIPANTLHKVVAGKDGLYLFAKFTPAL